MFLHKSPKVTIAAVLLMVTSLLADCTPPGVVPPPIDPVSETPVLVDVLREQFDAVTVPPTVLIITPTVILHTDTPSPVNTLTPVATVTPTRQSHEATKVIPSLPEPSNTPVPQVRVELNAIYLRRGPGEDYPVIRLLYNGEVAEVIAVFGAGNSWYNVRLNEGAVTGWVSSSVVQPVGAYLIGVIPTAATIPASITPSPTYTPTPTNTPVPERPQPTQTLRPPTPTVAIETPTIIPTPNPYP